MLDLRNVNVEGDADVKGEKEKVDVATAEMAAKINAETVGTMSDKIALIATLCDPSRPDKTVRKDPKTGKDYEHVIGTIVGYQFKALDNIEVPNVGTSIFYKSDGMDFNPETKNATIAVKKGEVFNLTHFETAKMLSTPEYNGEVTGETKGSMKVVIAYQKPGAVPKKRPDGRLALPLAYLRAAEKGVSIRDLKQVPVLDVKQKEVNGAVRKVKSPILPEFEKWAPLAQSRAVTPSMVKTQSGVKDNVLKFMSLLND